VKILTLAALLAAAFPLSSFAQSNVTIYGIVDAGIVSESGGAAGSVNKVTSGVGSASRIGFKGTEDLGGGLSAIFTLESGAKIDTGESDSTGYIFNRQAFVGLKSTTMGTLTLGKQYTPWYLALSQVADPFGAGYAGSAKNLFPAAGVNTRTPNTVVYSAPAYQGFQADVAYSTGEQAGDNDAGRQFGASLGYTNGPLTARLAYNNRNSDVAATSTTAAVSRGIGHNTLFAINYDFTFLKAYFAFGQDKGYNSAVLPVANAYAYAVAPKATTDSTDMLIGATAPLGQSGTVMASYIRKDDKEFNQDANQWAVGYSYALSKRTSAYAVFAKIKNKNGAGYTVGNNTEAGSGDKAYNLGIRHTF
jgi:predicted porin